MTSFRNIHNSLSSQCFNFLNDESFTDLILIADGRFLNCHKIVLAASSTYFKVIYFSFTIQEFLTRKIFFKEILTLLTDKKPAIVLKDVSYKHLQQVMTYIYCGTVDIPEQEVKIFRSILDSLKIQYEEDDDDGDFGEPEPEQSTFETSSAFPSFTIKEEPKDDFSIDFSNDLEMEALDENSSEPPEGQNIFQEFTNKEPKPLAIRFQPAVDGKVSLGRVVPNRKTQQFMVDHPMICPFCRKYFKTTKHRNEHVKYCFDNPNRVVSNCPICGKSVCDPYYLRKHMRNVHGHQSDIPASPPVAPIKIANFSKTQ